jgi:unsaturated rhamnogalacturonyl hydrolase
MPRFIIPLVAILFVSCSVGLPAVSAQAVDSEAPWSVRMAETLKERNPILKTRWHYELGTVLVGFQQLYEATGDRSYFDYIKTNVDEFVRPDGSIETYTVDEYNLDQVNTGKLLFLLHQETGDERYRMAADLLRRQLEEHPRTSEGGFWHKKVYPYQMWLDGIYMASPFYAQYARLNDQPEAFDDITRQITLITRYTRDPRTGLFYHAWDETREMLWADSLTGLSENFWGRALGWYSMALVDVLDHIPADHVHRGEVIRIVQQLAEALVRVQDPVTGTWYQVLDMPARKGNYHEASATAMFVYTLAKGVRMGYLDAKYMDSARRGYDGMIEHFITSDENGFVDMHGIVAVAGLGGRQQRDGSFEYYMSEDVVSNDWKGIGPFIMSSVEIERSRGLHGGRASN